MQEDKKKYILKSLNILTFKENKIQNYDNQKCLDRRQKACMLPSVFNV